MLYADIIALVLSDTDRANDTELLAVIDSKLRLVEARINRYLLVQAMVSKATINMDIGTEFYGPVTQYSAIKNVFVSPVSAPTNRTTLEYLAPEQMNTIIQNGQSVVKGYYSIVGNQIQVYPLRDNTYNLNLYYFQNIMPLTSTATSNWCSINNPDCYTAGLSAYVCAHAKDADGYAMWNDIFEKSLQSIEQQDETVSWSGTPLVIRVG